jgi:hypothetical protein
MKSLAILASSLGLAFVALADEPATSSKTVNPATVVYDDQSAFNYIKTLAGNWERMGAAAGHEHGTSSSVVSFKISAAGSTVMETYNAGKPNEMVSVYHMDGKTLLMTHYCALHNAPVMKFRKTDKPGEIKLDFFGGTNFDPKVDAHAHEGLIRIKDQNTFEVTSVGMAGGKPLAPTVSLMKRKE